MKWWTSISATIIFIFGYFAWFTFPIDGDIKSYPDHYIYVSQLLNNEQFTDGITGWNSTTTISVVDGILSFLPHNQYDRIESSYIVPNYTKFYIISRYKVASLNVNVGMLGGTGAIGTHSGSGQYETISSVITSGSNSIITLVDNKNSGWTQIDVDYIYAFNISTLIANKTYSSMYNTTFDLLTDLQIKNHLDRWVELGYFDENNNLKVLSLQPTIAEVPFYQEYNKYGSQTYWLVSEFTQLLISLNPMKTVEPVFAVLKGLLQGFTAQQVIDSMGLNDEVDTIRSWIESLLNITLPPIIVSP